MELRESPLESMVKKILITGINGYIGTVLAETLRKKGYTVNGWDANFFKKNSLGKYKNQYISRKIDIRQNNLDLSKIDCIIHLAALSNDPMGSLDEKLTFDINYKATVNLARRAKAQGVKRFIFSSSCSVYGIARDDIVNEATEVKPITTYATSKKMAEDALKKLATDNFCVCLLRNATVYGFSPRFRSDLVVNNLVTSGLALGEIRVLSDGTPWRPLVDVRDLCDIIYAFIEADQKKVNGEIFNVGFNESNYRIKDIIKIIKKCLPKCTIKFTGEHVKDTRSYRVNFAKLGKLFPNLKQKWPLQKSIQDLIKKLVKNKFTINHFQNEKFIRLSHINLLLSEKKLTKKLYWKQ